MSPLLFVLLALGLFASAAALYPGRSLAVSRRLRQVFSEDLGLFVDFDGELADNLLPLDAGGGSDSPLRHPWLTSLRCEGDGRRSGKLIIDLLVPAAADAEDIIDAHSSDYPELDEGQQHDEEAKRHEGVGWPFVHPRAWRPGQVLLGGQAWGCWRDETGTSEPFYVRLSHIKAERIVKSSSATATGTGSSERVPLRLYVTGQPTAVTECLRKLDLDVQYGSDAAALPPPDEHEGAAGGRGLFEWGFSTPKGDASFKWTPKQPVLWQVENLITVSAEKSYAGARIDYTLKASFDNLEMKSFEATAKITPQARLVLTAVLGSKYSSSRRIDIVPTTRLFTINIPLGFVDLTIPLFVSLRADLSFSAAARLAVQNVGLEFGYTMTVAAKYEPSKGFRTTHAGAPHFVVPPPSVDMSGSLSAEVSLTLNVSTAIFGTWPIAAIVKPYAAFNAAFPSTKCASQSTDVYAEAYYGVDGTVKVGKARMPLKIGGSVKEVTLPIPGLPKDYAIPILARTQIGAGLGLPGCFKNKIATFLVNGTQALLDKYAAAAMAWYTKLIAPKPSATPSYSVAPSIIPPSPNATVIYQAPCVWMSVAAFSEAGVVPAEIPLSRNGTGAWFCPIDGEYYATPETDIKLWPSVEPDDVELPAANAFDNSKNAAPETSPDPPPVSASPPAPADDDATFGGLLPDPNDDWRLDDDDSGLTTQGSVAPTVTRTPAIANAGAIGSGGSGTMIGGGGSGSGSSGGSGPGSASGSGSGVGSSAAGSKDLTNPGRSAIGKRSVTDPVGSVGGASGYTGSLPGSGAGAAKFSPTPSVSRSPSASPTPGSFGFAVAPSGAPVVATPAFSRSPEASCVAGVKPVREGIVDDDSRITQSPSRTASKSISISASASFGASLSTTRTASRTPTGSRTPVSFTSTVTVTPSSAETPTNTGSPGASPTRTRSISLTSTETGSETGSETSSETSTKSESSSRTASETPSTSLSSSAGTSMSSSVAPSESSSVSPSVSSAPEPSVSRTPSETSSPSKTSQPAAPPLVFLPFTKDLHTPNTGTLDLPAFSINQATLVPDVLGIPDNAMNCQPSLAMVTDCWTTTTKIPGLPTGSSARTLALWVRRGYAATLRSSTLIGYGAPGTPRGAFVLAAKNNWMLEILLDKSLKLSTNYKIPLDVWTHVAVTFSGVTAVNDGGTFEVYINCTQIASSDFTYSTDFFLSPLNTLDVSALKVGQALDDNGHGPLDAQVGDLGDVFGTFVGDIDSVLVTNTALTPGALGRYCELPTRRLLRQASAPPAAAAASIRSDTRGRGLGAAPAELKHLPRSVRKTLKPVALSATAQSALNARFTTALSAAESSGQLSASSVRLASLALQKQPVSAARNLQQSTSSTAANATSASIAYQACSLTGRCAWEVGPFTPCDAACGQPSFRFRDVRCRDQSTGLSVPFDACRAWASVVGDMPVHLQPCDGSLVPPPFGVDSTGASLSRSDLGFDGRNPLVPACGAFVEYSSTKCNPTAGVGALLALPSGGSRYLSDPLAAGVPPLSLLTASSIAAAESTAALTRSPLGSCTKLPPLPVGAPSELIANASSWPYVRFACGAPRSVVSANPNLAAGALLGTALWRCADALCSNCSLIAASATSEISTCAPPPLSIGGSSRLFCDLAGKEDVPEPIPLPPSGGVARSELLGFGGRVSKLWRVALPETDAGSPIAGVAITIVASADAANEALLESAASSAGTSSVPSGLFTAAAFTLEELSSAMLTPAGAAASRVQLRPVPLSTLAGAGTAGLAGAVPEDAFSLWAASATAAALLRDDNRTQATSAAASQLQASAPRAVRAWLTFVPSTSLGYVHGGSIFLSTTAAGVNVTLSLSFSPVRELMPSGAVALTADALASGAVRGLTQSTGLPGTRGMALVAFLKPYEPATLAASANASKVFEAAPSTALSVEKAASLYRLQVRALSPGQAEAWPSGSDSSIREGSAAGAGIFAEAAAALMSAAGSNSTTDQSSTASSNDSGSGVASAVRSVPPSCFLDCPAGWPYGLQARLALNNTPSTSSALVHARVLRLDGPGDFRDDFRYAWTLAFDSATAISVVGGGLTPASLARIPDISLQAVPIFDAPAAGKSRTVTVGNNGFAALVARSGSAANSFTVKVRPSLANVGSSSVEQGSSLPPLGTVAIYLAPGEASFDARAIATAPSSDGWYQLSVNQASPWWSSSFFTIILAARGAAAGGLASGSIAFEVQITAYTMVSEGSMTAGVEIPSTGSPLVLAAPLADDFVLPRSTNSTTAATNTDRLAIADSNDQVAAAAATGASTGSSKFALRLQQKGDAADVTTGDAGGLALFGGLSTAVGSAPSGTRHQLSAGLAGLSAGRKDLLALGGRFDAATAGLLRTSMLLSLQASPPSMEETVASRRRALAAMQAVPQASIVSPAAHLFGDSPLAVTIEAQESTAGATGLISRRRARGRRLAESSMSPALNASNAGLALFNPATSAWTSVPFKMVAMVDKSGSPLLQSAIAATAIDPTLFCAAADSGPLTPDLTSERLLSVAKSLASGEGITLEALSSFGCRRASSINGSAIRLQPSSSAAEGDPLTFALALPPSTTLLLLINGVLAAPSSGDASTATFAHRVAFGSPASLSSASVGTSSAVQGAGAATNALVAVDNCGFQPTPLFLSLSSAVAAPVDVTLAAVFLPWRELDALSETLTVVTAAGAAVSAVRASGLSQGSTRCPLHVWKAGKWGACSAVCGLGSQSRLVTCQAASNGATVSASVCDPATQPPSSQACDAGMCSLAVGAWGPCDAACGGLGTQTRPVACRSGNGLGPVVPSYYCKENAPSEAAATMQTCTADPCAALGDVEETDEYYRYTFGWQVGEWGPCSATCGGGVQKRALRCVRMATAIDPATARAAGLPLSASSPADFAVCEALTKDASQRPATLQACSLTACPVVSADLQAARISDLAVPASSRAGIPAGLTRLFSIPTETETDTQAPVCVKANVLAPVPFCAPSAALAAVAQCAANTEECVTRSLQRVAASSAADDTGKNWGSTTAGFNLSLPVPRAPAAAAAWLAVPLQGCYEANIACITSISCAALSTTVQSAGTAMAAECQRVFSQALNSTCPLPAAAWLNTTAAALGVTSSVTNLPSVVLTTQFAIGTSADGAGALRLESDGSAAGAAAAAASQAVVGWLPSFDSATGNAIGSSLPAVSSSRLREVSLLLPAGVGSALIGISSPEAGVALDISTRALGSNEYLLDASARDEAVTSASETRLARSYLPLKVEVLVATSTSTGQSTTTFESYAAAANYNATAAVSSAQIPAVTDADLRAGRVALRLTLSCGAFVADAVNATGQVTDRASSPVFAGMSHAQAAALLLRLANSSSSSSSASTGARARLLAPQGWESYAIPALLAAGPSSSWPHTAPSGTNMITVALPPLPNFSLEKDEMLELSVPGRFLQSRADLRLPFPVLRVRATSRPCVVSSWGPWSPCSSKTCLRDSSGAPIAARSGGSRTRTRAVLTPAAGLGAACPALSETRSCSACDACEGLSCNPRGGACLYGRCVCSAGYGGEGCWLPTSTVVRRPVSTGEWSSCMPQPRLLGSSSSSTVKEATLSLPSSAILPVTCSALASSTATGTGTTSDGSIKSAIGVALPEVSTTTAATGSAAASTTSTASTAFRSPQEACAAVGASAGTGPVTLNMTRPCPRLPLGGLTLTLLLTSPNLSPASWLNPEVSGPLALQLAKDFASILGVPSSAVSVLSVAPIGAKGSDGLALTGADPVAAATGLVSRGNGAWQTSLASVSLEVLISAGMPSPSSILASLSSSGVFGSNRLLGPRNATATAAENNKRLLQTTNGGASGSSTSFAPLPAIPDLPSLSMLVAGQSPLVSVVALPRQCYGRSLNDKAAASRSDDVCDITSPAAATALAASMASFSQSQQPLEQALAIEQRAQLEAGFLPAPTPIPAPDTAVLSPAGIALIATNGVTLLALAALGAFVAFRSSPSSSPSSRSGTRRASVAINSHSKPPGLTLAGGGVPGPRSSFKAPFSVQSPMHAAGGDGSGTAAQRLRRALSSRSAALFSGPQDGEQSAVAATLMRTTRPSSAPGSNPLGTTNTGTVRNTRPLLSSTSGSGKGDAGSRETSPRRPVAAFVASPTPAGMDVFRSPRVGYSATGAAEGHSNTGRNGRRPSRRSQSPYREDVES